MIAAPYSICFHHLSVLLALLLPPLSPPPSTSTSQIQEKTQRKRKGSISISMGASSHIQPSKFISRAIYILIPLALLHFYPFPLPITTTTLKPNAPPPPPPPRISTKTAVAAARGPQRCSNYAEGRWVPSDRAPLYNGTSCAGIIKPGQNCMAHGRPDTAYLRYRWQPRAAGCSLPPFDPSAFLSLVRDRHVAFIGDSMARNQLESLLCLLSSSSSSAPELTYRSSEDNRFRRWVFASHNATFSVLWSPFLVAGLEKSPQQGLNHNKLFLDSPDRAWADELSRFDVVVFSIGHWFLHPAIYLEKGRVLGCHHCPEMNGTEEIGFFDVFRKAVRTTLKTVREEESGERERLAVVTTFSPAHFEGEWDKAGACPRKVPYGEGEKEMEYMDAEMRKIEIEEVSAAAAAAASSSQGAKKKKKKKKGLRIEALDVTRLAMMRADGHPGPYMNPNPFGELGGGLKEEEMRVQNDCVHWCLPGPIDTWNEILMEIVKRWVEDQQASNADHQLR